jgi:hypothetical protein
MRHEQPEAQAVLSGMMELSSRSATASQQKQCSRAASEHVRGTTLAARCAQPHHLASVSGAAARVLETAAQKALLELVNDGRAHVEHVGRRAEKKKNVPQQRGDHPPQACWGWHMEVRTDGRRLAGPGQHLRIDECSEDVAWLTSNVPSVPPSVPHE